MIERGPLSEQELQAQGFVVGVADNADGYFEDAQCKRVSLNQSIATVLVKQSPAHAWFMHPRLGGGPREISDALDEGSIIDQMVVGGRPSIVLLDFENYKKKEAQEKRDQARAEGKIPVLPHQLEKLTVAVDSIRVRLALAGVDLNRGRTQVPLYWVEYSDDWVPVQCRALLDQVEGLTIRDLKKTKDASTKAIGRAVELYGYDIQTAAYIAGLEACMPGEAGRISFEWVFVESKGFCAAHVCKPRPSMLAYGRTRWQYAVNLWARCISSNIWPGYEGEITEIEASPWALREMEEMGMLSDEED